MKKLFGLFFILLGFLVLFGTLTNSVIGRWFTFGSTITDAVSLDGIERIEIRGDALDLRIIPDHREEVSAVLRGGRRDALSLSRSGDTISISVGKKWYQWIFLRDQYRLDVRIPRDYKKSLAIDVDAGNVRLHGLSGNRPMNLKALELELDSGEVYLSHLQAEQIRHRSWSGNVEARHVVTDEADWHLTSGNLHLRNYSGALGVEMVSGDLRVQMDQLSGPVDADLTSGDLRLNLPKDAGFTLDAEVSSGDIHVDFPMHVVKRDHRSVSGSHGNGKHPVRLRATSGDIRID
jgi:lia operon protein LiaG